MEAGHADDEESIGQEERGYEDGEAESVGVGVSGEDDGVDEVGHCDEVVGCCLLSAGV